MRRAQSTSSLYDKISAFEQEWRCVPACAVDAEAVNIISFAARAEDDALFEGFDFAFCFAIPKERAVFVLTEMQRLLSVVFFHRAVEFAVFS